MRIGMESRMGFEILEKNIDPEPDNPVPAGPHRIFRLLNEETKEYADILPDLGGTVRSLCLVPAGPKELKALPVSLLEADPPEEIFENPWFRGRILFPFNDRIIGARYRFAGHTHTLPVNDPETGDAIHGFLYATPLEITRQESGEDAAELRLEGSIDEAPGYPFHLKIRMDYRLDGKGFQIGFRILNSGSAPAPFSIGWHPYFTLPGAETAETGTTNSGAAGSGASGTPGASSEAGSRAPAEDFQLRLPSDRYIETDRDQVPSGRLLPVDESLLDFRVFRTIGPHNLDHGFLNPEGWAECRRGSLTLRIEQSELFGYTQVFIPPSRSSIAIEPVSAGTDAFNRPELGLRVLKPGKEAVGWVRVRLLRTDDEPFS